MLLAGIEAKRGEEMASVEIRNAVKFYGSVQALHSVNLAIEDGEFIVLVGPSGCGKTTLLRMIAGLEVISRGDILISEEIVNDLKPKDRDVAMVFQNYALYPHKTVRQNIAFALRMRKVAKDEIGPRVEEAAAVLNLEAYLDRYPRQLSGGQRQRVAMGRALVRRPQLFLFDEPLSNLDAKLRIQMRTEIKALQKQVGTTSIYVTHDQVEAMTLADRVVVMNDGRVEQIGAPMELFEKPANQFVASFIGSPPMNLFSGTINVDEGSGRFVPKGAAGAFPLPPEGKHWQEQQIVFGIRPEHISLSAADNDTLDVTAKVKTVEPMGSETLVVIEIDGQDVRVLLRDGTQISAGQNVALVPDPAHIHLFSAESGAALT